MQNNHMPGTLIRRYREMRNYSQKYVAGQMGISQNAYSKIENNVTQLTVQHIKQLSAILEISPLELLKDDFEIHKPLHIQQDEGNAQDVLNMLMHLRKRLEDKRKMKHNLYPVVVNLLHVVDSIIADIE